MKTTRPALIQLNAESLDNSPVFNPAGTQQLGVKDDTFDRLFDKVDLKKMARPPPASCISASDRSSDLTSSNQSHSRLDHAGLFQSFRQENMSHEVAGTGRTKKKSTRRLKSRTEKVVSSVAKLDNKDLSDLYRTLDVIVKFDSKVIQIFSCSVLMLLPLLKSHLFSFEMDRYSL